MSKEDIIRMAREAGCIPVRHPEYDDDVQVFATPDVLERFAALVRADEREKYKWDVHSCGPTCKRYACMAMREAVQAEREACAKVCDGEATIEGIAQRCAAAIRAREQA
jgi:hypothetical protein